MKGSYDGAPAGLKPVASVLQEDWITCLAEGSGGVLWVGHRDHGYEALRMADLSLLHVEKKGRVRAIGTGNDDAFVVGFYGDGAAGAPQQDTTLPAPTTLPVPTTLPSSASAPDEAALVRMRTERPRLA